MHKHLYVDINKLSQHYFKKKGFLGIDISTFEHNGHLLWIARFWLSKLKEKYLI